MRHQNIKCGSKISMPVVSIWWGGVGGEVFYRHDMRREMRRADAAFEIKLKCIFKVNGWNPSRSEYFTKCEISLLLNEYKIYQVRNYKIF